MQLTEKNLFKVLADLVSSQDSSPPLKAMSVFLTTQCILLDNSESVSPQGVLPSCSFFTQFKANIWQERQDC